MENLAHIKRKHFRFPAYDDEIGVKLTSGNKRTLFEQDQLLTETDMQPSTLVTDPVNTQMTHTQTSSTGHSDEQIADLAWHKSNLPNYMMSHNKIAMPKAKPNLFGNMHKRASQSFNNQAASNKTRTSFSKTSANDSRSRFVPKYIPASVIPEPNSSSLSEQELISAMKKDQSSYLLFDEEPTAFQAKGNQDPTVKKFNIPKDTPEIPVTRRQYQQIKPDMERFGKEDISHSLPRSRKELKTAKQNAKSQTAYGQKVAEAEQEKKRSILDKSLSGIIEDSSMELENSKYFN
ncbi:hypothetical protein GIX45_05270 [Erwinia sp. CPCC 100877]|nr:hypothetical protein [Erwinia sp. CPCC 100877]